MFAFSSMFENEEELIRHYVSYHNVDESNWFFQKLFQTKNKAIYRQCIRCDEFLMTEHHKAVQNFLKYNDEGKSIPFEDKPVEIQKHLGLNIDSIEFQKHKNYYDFSNPEELVDSLLKNVRYRFIPSGKKWMKCSFTSENIHQSPYQDLRPIINSRYWATQPYEGVYFNDFIFFGLRQKF